ITASDAGNGSIGGTATVAVSAAAATHFVVTAPASAIAGTGFSITVAALDSFGNTVTGYTGTVHFTSSDGQASLPANSTLTNGTRSFSVTLKTAGTQTITASDTGNGSITGNAGVAVSAASASHFLVTTPVSTTAG